MKACVDRALEQYPALEAYFRVEIIDDPSRTTDTIIAALKNTFTKLYLEFMSYVLDLLTEFNTTFQSETPLLHKLKPAVQHLICHDSRQFHRIKSHKEQIGPKYRPT